MLSTFFFFALSLSASAAPHWHDNLASALAESGKTGKPVLVDFQAPWCYSCYFMEKHVLEGAAFAASAERFVLLKVDVDKEEGHALKEKHKVTFLPSYLVLSPKQEPLGRIVGEQTEGDFLKQLAALTAGSAGDPSEQAVSGLRKRLAAGEYDEAAKEIARLPKTTAAALSERNDWKLLTARLELKRAIAAKNAKGIAALKTALSLDDSCESAYDVAYAEELVAALGPEEKKAVLETERAALLKLAQFRLFVPAAQRCADFRTGIEELADVDEKLGDAAGRKRLLEQTVSFLDQQGITPGDDRNFDDNKRFFLELLEDDKRLADFYAVLISAYPSDYVYAYRRARYLQEHQRASEALPFIEKAAQLAYGANRLKVTEVRARILAALGRKGEAKDLLKRDAKSARKAFPAEAAGLDKLSRQL